MVKGNIFLIEEDNDSRPLLRKKLKKLGYKVSLAVDEEDALDRVETGCLKADLVLTSLLRKTPEMILDITRGICQKGNLDIPIVVIAAKYGTDLEGRNVQLSEKEYITYLVDPNQLSDLLARLVQKNL